MVPERKLDVNFMKDIGIHGGGESNVWSTAQRQKISDLWISIIQ